MSFNYTHLQTTIQFIHKLHINRTKYTENDV